MAPHGHRLVRSRRQPGHRQPRGARREVLTTLAGKVAQGDVDQYQPVPLGFTPLDKTIGGGLRAGELLLIGGAQGTGKTTMAVQMARNIVMGGQASVLYVCYEHDEEYLLNRIIAMESALQHLPGRVNGVKLAGRAQGDPEHLAGAGGEGFADLMANPRLRPALERLSIATARTCSCCAARRPRTRSRTCTSSSSATRSCRATAGWSCSSTTCRRCRSSPTRRPRPRR